MKVQARLTRTQERPEAPPLLPFLEPQVAPSCFLLPILHPRLSRAWMGGTCSPAGAFALKYDPGNPGTHFPALPCQLLPPGPSPKISLGHAVTLAHGSFSTWHMVAPSSTQSQHGSLTRHGNSWASGPLAPSSPSQLSGLHHFSICSPCPESQPGKAMSSLCRRKQRCSVTQTCH